MTEPFETKATIEKLLAQVPPKFLLDHYWAVINLLRRVFVDLGYELLTISNIKEIISEILRNPAKENPIIHRELSRAVGVVEEVVNVLVNAGLLLEKGELLQKTKDFVKFYNSLDKIRASAKRYVAWAIWYLYYQNGRTEFSTLELVNLITYSDEECINELPRLVVWKRDKNEWSRILKEHNGKWRLVRKVHPSTKHILLKDLHDKLCIAIYELSKSKGEFYAEEILEKLRELECKSVDRILKRIGLRCESGEWKINDPVLKNIRNILLVEVVGWPSFTQLISRNPYFKLQSRDVYVDMPVWVILNFFEEIEKICNKHKNDLVKMYDEAKMLADKFNRELESELKDYGGSWISFVVRKQFGRKPFGVQVKIDWPKFFLFLDTYAKTEKVSLTEKYEEYIFHCRSALMFHATRWKMGDYERVQENVRLICGEEIEQIHESLITLINKINEAKNNLRKVSRHTQPLTLLYFSEMISTLQNLIFLVENGSIPACYREMRKVLENLSWTMFDDLLFYKKEVKQSFGDVPYRYTSKKWYDWASEQKLVIRNLKELENEINHLVEIIRVYGKVKGFNWSKKQIKSAFFKNMSYPLFLLLAGVGVQIPQKIEEHVPRYRVEEIVDAAANSLRVIIRDLKGRRLTKTDETLLRELVETIKAKKPSVIVPPYPSNEFVLSFVSRILSVSLVGLYREYSYFVHSYIPSWHVFPFSSVLEFKIFKYELYKFIETVWNLINAYFKTVWGLTLKNKKTTIEQMQSIETN